MANPTTGKLTLAGNLLFVAGALFLVVGAASLARMRTVSGWPTVPGRVISSALAKDVVQRTDTAGQRETRTQYRAEVVYEYRVDGVLLRGDRIGPLEQHSRRPEPMQAQVDRYPVGRDLTVHHDPDDPREALLEPAVEGQPVWAPLALAGVLIGIGVVLRGSDRAGSEPAPARR